MSVSPTQLSSVTPTIMLQPGTGPAYLSSASGSATGYSVSAKVSNGGTFTITMNGGTVGPYLHAVERSGCENGTW